MIHDSGSIPSIKLEGDSEGLYKIEGLYRKKIGVRGLLTKEKII